jgi:hypothetical protein
LRDAAASRPAFLTFADSYVFGTDITTLQFISFDYASSQFSFNLASSDVAFVAGGLNADGSFDSTGYLNVQASTSTPVFLANAVGFAAYETTEEDDHGSPFAFSLMAPSNPGTVLEAATWTMMLLGCAGLSLASYRKARQP